ncbi:MAG: adenosine deaminase [Ktedonobacteraceae bacterium]|nr:adenosine deaminase [Ktedonobacteraceae bacterium]
MERTERVKEYLRAVPKVELHVHLEGSIRAETLLALAKRNRVALPVATVEEARQWFAYRDFAHFVEIFATVSTCLKTAEDYELIAYEFGAEMARQHVRYAEVTFSASMHGFTLGIPFDTYFRGLQQGRARAKVDFGVEMRWVFDIVRAARDGRLVERADYTTALALECRREGIVALGLGGSEAKGPPELFTRWFEKARAEGLHSAPHAGETMGPESVWVALQQLGAERIGHGVRSIEDPRLVAHLAQQQIPLEICPCSNVCLGVYPSLEEHPLPRLYKAGVPFSVNSDDPPLFNTTLNDNVYALYEPLHLSLEAIDEILLNGVRQSFLEAEEKEQMEREFRVEMRRLRGELGLDE